MDAPTEMEERRKSAMVMYQIESDLGVLVRNAAVSLSSLPKALVKIVETRAQPAPGATDGERVANFIRSTYLGELLQALRHLFADRSEDEAIKRLTAICDMFEVFDIRNAICHPNRPFPPEYWRRTAAIASDPAIRSLGLESVTDCLAAAEAGMLRDPPNSWLDLLRWELPNNLPPAIEHHLTGLVGRKSESKLLEKLLANTKLNLIAIVGPGGVGKTALVLDVLVEATKSRETSSWADRILYVTAKNERLTAVGIESIEAGISSLDEIRLELDPYLQEPPTEDGRVQRVLLCIDNLETILRDSPSQFDEFYLALPPQWKVVVTSRVSVNSATVLPLSGLNRGGAASLARAYAPLRNVSLEEQVIAKLVDDCERNPLAIRLCIDAFAAGRPLPDVTVEMRGRLVEFSYKNLVGTLSNVSRAVLECLFVVPRGIDRSRLCLLLGRSADEIAEAFRELSGTALIKRIPAAETETYELADLVRELLIVQPVDDVARRDVQREIRRNRLEESTLGISAASSGISPATAQYLPEGSRPVDAQLANEVTKALASHDRRRQMTVLKVVQAAAEQHRGPVLSRLAGLLCAELDDTDSAKEWLENAAFGSPQDICSLLKLSSIYRVEQQIDDARRCGQALLQNSALNPSVVGYGCAQHATLEYWLTELWGGEVGKVLDVTDTWQAAEFPSTFGSLRAQALRVVASEIVLKDSPGFSQSLKVEQAIVSACEIWDALFNTDGYGHVYGSAVRKLIKTAEASAFRMFLRSPGAATVICAFIDRHLLQICNADDRLEQHRSDLAKSVAVLRELACDVENPLAMPRWNNAMNLAPLRARRFLHTLRGEVVLPGSRNGRRNDFTKVLAEDGREYFLSRKHLADQECWSDLQGGERVLIIPDRRPADGGPLPRVHRAALIDGGVRAK